MKLEFSSHPDWLSLQFTHSKIVFAYMQSIDTYTFPHLHLLVSGGNSQLILLEEWDNWSIIGQTLDDAAGESFDKIGRMIGLLYPAGVYLAKIAKLKQENSLNLPLGMLKSADLNYSFSGLKTAVRYLVQKQNIPGFKFEKALTNSELEMLLAANQVEDLDNPKLQFIYKVCVSTQSVIVEQLVRKTEKAIKEFKPASLGLSGGVSANLLLRLKMQELATKHEINKLYVPNLKLTGDNAVMIGLAGLASAL